MNDRIERVAGWLFAGWHLRRPPLAGAGRDERARWRRDHCGTFAGRWFGIGAVLWFAFMTPFVSSLALAVGALIGLAMGMYYITAQILAQGRAGRPPVDPPVAFHERDRKPADDEGRDDSR
jgi:hypothetical protein